MQKLLGADNYYHLGYRNMADILKKVSFNPEEDLPMLFRQLVFNVLIGNTDDHLKNFSMLYDGSWRLSPAYDIVPNVGQNKEHVLSINNSTLLPDRKALLQEAKFFGIKQQKKADDIIDSVLSVVAHWKKVFLDFDVPDNDIEIIGRDIEKRISSVA